MELDVSFLLKTFGSSSEMTVHVAGHPSYSGPIGAEHRTEEDWRNRERD